MSDVKELEPKDKEKYKKGFFSRLFGSKDDGKDGKKSAEAVRLQYPVLCACWSLDTRWVALGDVAGNVVLYRCGPLLQIGCLKFTYRAYGCMWQCRYCGA